MRDLFELADGIIALVAAALGALSMALYGAQGVLRTQNAAYEQRVGFLEKEVDRLKLDLARVEQERASSATQKQAEIDALQRAIRGDDQLDAMVALLTEMRTLLTRLDGGAHECPAT